MKIIEYFLIVAIFVMGFVISVYLLRTYMPFSTMWQAIVDLVNYVRTLI